MIEQVIVNVYGDRQDQIIGSSAGYEQYLAGYAAANDKLEYNVRSTNNEPTTPDA